MDFPLEIRSDLTDAAVQVNIFKNYDVTRQAIEEPFVTYKFGFLQRNCWVMLNRCGACREPRTITSDNS